MMMPANYSVIAENEMTYVNGGANFIDAIGAVTAPIWTLDNVKTFNTNIVTLVGNTFLQSTIDRTIGVLFSGNTTWKEVGNIGKNLFGTNVKGDPIDKLSTTWAWLPPRTPSRRLMLSSRSNQI